MTPEPTSPKPTEAGEPDPIAAIATDVIDHMNADHGDTLRLYALAFAGIDADAAVMTSVDRNGFAMRVHTGTDFRDIRLAFPAAVHDADEVRAELVAMAKAARAR